MRDDKKTRNRIILQCSSGCFLGLFVFTFISVMENKHSVTTIVIVDIISILSFILIMVFMLMIFLPKKGK